MFRFLQGQDNLEQQQMYRDLTVRVAHRMSTSCKINDDVHYVKDAQS